MADSQQLLKTVSAVVLKQPSPNQWTTASWRLLGSLPGLSESQLDDARLNGDLHIFADLSIHLYSQHCDAYYINLTSVKPKLYFICTENNERLEPILLTVDFDEATAFMESGDQVLEAPLCETLCVWLEQFVLKHYQPEKLKKRRRTEWHSKDVSS